MLGPSAAVNCTLLMSSVETDPDSSSLWSYAACPDIDECRLALHNCHADATCHNTPTSFYCECQRGFAGDGVTTCNRTSVSISLLYNCQLNVCMSTVSVSSVSVCPVYPVCTVCPACPVCLCVVATTSVSRASVPVRPCTSVSVTLVGRRWIAPSTADATITVRVNVVLVSVTSVITGHQLQRVTAANLAVTAVQRTLLLVRESNVSLMLAIGQH